MTTRVTKIELGNHTTQYNAFDEPEYNTWGGSADIGHIAFDCSGEQEPLSEEQQAYLGRSKAIANFNDPQNIAAWEQQQAKEEEMIQDDDEAEEARKAKYYETEAAKTASYNYNTIAEAAGTASHPIPISSRSTT